MTIFSRAVQFATQTLARSRMRAMLPLWARVSLDPQARRAPHLTGFVQDFRNYVTARGPDSTKPMNPKDLDRFMSLWTQSGIGPAPLAMAALLTRDMGLAVALCGRADLEPDRPTTERERALVMAYTPNLSPSNHNPDQTESERSSLDILGPALDRMARLLGHGAEPVLHAMSSMQEARALSASTLSFPATRPRSPPRI